MKKRDSYVSRKNVCPLERACALVVDMCAVQLEQPTILILYCIHVDTCHKNNCRASLS